jgi:hypothetical protein
MAGVKMTPRRRITLTAIGIALFVFAMTIYMRTRPIDVHGVSLPPAPENNGYTDLIRLAEETVAKSEKSFTMREGLRLLPLRGDEELRRKFLDEMEGTFTELKSLVKRPLIPPQRASYETDEFPGDSVQYWSKLCAIHIHQSLLRKDYHKAAADLEFSISLHQRISEYASDMTRSGANLGISSSLYVVYKVFEQLPDA